MLTSSINTPSLSQKPQNPSDQALTSYEREKLISLLTIILSHHHSPSKYNELICNALCELKISNEKFLYLCIKSLQRVNPSHNDTIIISSYLFRMQNFLKLFKDIEEKEINNQIRTIAKHLVYEKMDKNILMMKIGDLGKKAYILLHGNVDVVVKTASRMKVTIKEYLLYIAKLIKYKEYGLINFVLNDNFPTFHLVVEYDLALPSGNGNMIQEGVQDKFSSYMNKKEKENEIASYFKLNTNNQSIRKQAKPTKIRKYKVSQLLQMLNKVDGSNNGDNVNVNGSDNGVSDDIESDNNKNEVVQVLLSKKKEKELLYSTTVQNYIDRIAVNGQILPPDELTHPHQHSTHQHPHPHHPHQPPIKYGTFIPDEDNHEIIVNIYSYMKVATLTTGALFGEIALSNPLAQRTASIITTSNCHFGSLNKTSYNLSLKTCKDKQLQRLLRFITSIQVFHGLNTLILNKKYLNNFSFRRLSKGEYVLQQGDIPRSIYLLREGEYEITIKTNLNDLVDVIKHFYMKLPKSSKKIEILNQSQRAIANEVKVNQKLHKVIFTTQVIHLSTAECPNVVGLSNFIDEETGKYAFNVECKSAKGEYLELSNIFYEDMRYKEYTIEENEEVFIDQKVKMIIDRMNTIRNAKISTFFDFRKYTYDLGSEIESNIQKNNAMKRMKDTQRTVIKAKDIKLINNNNCNTCSNVNNNNNETVCNAWYDDDITLTQISRKNSGYYSRNVNAYQSANKKNFSMFATLSANNYNSNSNVNGLNYNNKTQIFNNNTNTNTKPQLITLGSYSSLKDSPKHKITPSKFRKDNNNNTHSNTNNHPITNFIIEQYQDKNDYMNQSPKFWHKDKVTQTERILKQANLFMKENTKNIKIESPSHCSLTSASYNKANTLKKYNNNESDDECKIKTCTKTQTSFRLGTIEPFKLLNNKKQLHKKALYINNIINNSDVIVKKKVNLSDIKSSDNPLSGVPITERAKFLQITINDIKSAFICRRSTKGEFA